MSLNFYLKDTSKEHPCICCECGHEHTNLYSKELFCANITHNLIDMAQAADIYKLLWLPDEIGVTHAKQIIEPLEKALKLLENKKERFVIYNPENGWGDYVGFFKFCTRVLAACKEFPEAQIEVCG